MRWAWVRAVVMACVLPVAAAHGQDASVTADPQLSTALGALRPQSRVRIITQGVHIGDFRAFDADSVRIDQREGVRLVALRDIRTVSRGIRQTGRGAVIGGIAGGLLFGAMAYGLSTAFCDSSNCGDGRAAAALYGAALGAGSGALVGAGIGALVPGWRTVYTRPR